MGYKTELPAVLKKYGLQVEVVPGWETRGNVSFNPKGSVNHHTAGPATGVRPSLNIVTNGRSDLKGPLCNVFLDRNGVAVVVAAGRANHAGTGGYRGLIGNSSVLGTEAESTGVGLNPWTPAQLEAYPKVVAALQEIAGQKTADTNCNHKTWAPTRKVDCASLTDNWFKVQANELLKTGGDDMYTDADRDRDDQNGNVLWNILNQLGGNYDNKTRTISWKGWPSFVDSKATLTLIDFIRWIDKNVSGLAKDVAQLKADVAELKQK
jgi:hypothetical protein